VSSPPATDSIRAADCHGGLHPGRTRLRAALAGEPAAPTTFGRRERFAAYIAHELGAPIALQLTLVEVTLADPEADAAAMREMGKRVVASCEQQHGVAAFSDPNGQGQVNLSGSPRFQAAQKGQKDLRGKVGTARSASTCGG